MKNRLVKSAIEIRSPTIAKYGVFATKDFKKDETIEECPVLLLDNDVPDEFKNYIFLWENDNIIAIPLGFGCLYNHAELPNAEWIRDKNNQLITFKALKPIYKGDEISIYYSPAWLSIRGIKPKTTTNYLFKNSYRLGRIIFILTLFLVFKMALFPTPQDQQKASGILNIEHSQHSFQKWEHKA